LVERDYQVQAVTVSDYIWQTVVVLLFWAGGAAMGRARLNEQSALSFQARLSRTRHIYLIFPLLLAFPYINFYLSRHVSVQWDMPDWLQIHWAALSWGIVSGLLAYVFGFCSKVAFTLGHRWKWCPALLGAMVELVIQVYAGWSSRPRLLLMGEARTSKDGVILQSSAFTCVPAAGANIATILGVHTTEKELAQLFHTTRDGTFPAQALEGLRELGISGRKVTASSGIRTVKPPAMLFVIGDTHAVVYAGMADGLFEIWNPNFGKRFMPEKQLGVIWAGHALEFKSAGH
jgi:Peptidase C39 family